ADLVGQARRVAGNQGTVTAVGVGLPGFVDEEAGLVEYAANLGWRKVAAASVLSGMCGIPVALGHDVRLGGRAEGRLGAAGGVRDYLFIALGTGIASALTLGGQQRRGPSALAGEIGHVVAIPGGPPCGCGGRGCLEQVASASGVGREYRRRCLELSPTSLPASASGPLVGLPPVVTSAEVLEMAREGDLVAQEVWAQAVQYLGQAIAFAHGCVELEVVVIGGGMAKAGAQLMEPLEASVRSHLPCTPAPRLALAQLGDEAASLGAALLARDLSRGDRSTLP
ncbi:MAG TPA: ROK family protein, partial [Acidimicrobiales bacterium]|nr:ROK family protein [Acidimicrobiales bacterium]